MKTSFLQRFFNLQTKNITLAAFILGATSFLSAILGLLRDRMLAGRFGAGSELDVYYAAFRLPDFIAMVLVMGAIAAAITPVFSHYLVGSREKAWRFLANLLNLFLISLIVLSLLLFIFAPQIVSLIAPGFEAGKREATIDLTRIMLFSPILLGISNIISSILRVFRRFLITSVSPIMYNLGIIFGILFFLPRMGLVGLAWGVVLGGFLHFLIQLPILFKIGFSPQNLFNFKEPGFIKVLKLTLPRSLGLASSQINLIIITVLASNLAAGSIAVFNLADGLSRPLLTFIANSFSVAAFPVLSLAFSKKNKEKFLRVFSEAFSKTLIFILPLSFLLFLFRVQIVELIFKVGKFGVQDATLTAGALAMFTLGIFSQGLVLLIAKAFYALHDTKIPALSSILGMVVNISLAFLFIRLLSFPNFFRDFLAGFLNLENAGDISVIALPLALSLSSIFQFILLYFLFRQRLNKFLNSNV